MMTKNDLLHVIDTLDDRNPFKFGLALVNEEGDTIPL
jgi:hypothetical protein